GKVLIFSKELVHFSTQIDLHEYCVSPHMTDHGTWFSWFRRELSWFRRELSWFRRELSWFRRELSWFRRELSWFRRELSWFRRELSWFRREHSWFTAAPPQYRSPLSELRFKIYL
ncbi:hypothetical protein FHG87_023937, partial [Trinorchestia longiramus]